MIKIPNYVDQACESFVRKLEFAGTLCRNYHTFVNSRMKISKARL